ncbi:MULTISPECIES: hypothetical protein [Glutamicibacter]|uniref:Uncharacterized protein n=2 Tax=Glutamicibacter arilaitensis TaxID=256701 RepID=A0A2N7RY42_9MICC|nr:hypothetical protein [Glutamicibacter arilaitensis]PMQ18812.1 hypothetical protein CIK84_15570 [Glutamicibacter arilaitensis]CBT77179.1 hypothetical protein AARI_29830 [Glutamicibacter arilaitensis Re117]HCJ55613.1 hypothetical protein [Glutamicibacter sp.]
MRCNQARIFRRPYSNLRLRPAGLLIRLLQIVQDVEDLGVGDVPGCRLALFPAAVGSRRDLQSLNSQGLACLLDCVAALALMVDELGD